MKISIAICVNKYSPTEICLQASIVGNPQPHFWKKTFNLKPLVPKIEGCGPGIVENAKELRKLCHNYFNERWLREMMPSLAVDLMCQHVLPTDIAGTLIIWKQYDI